MRLHVMNDHVRRGITNARQTVHSNLGSADHVIAERVSNPYGWPKFASGWRSTQVAPMEPASAQDAVTTEFGEYQGELTWDVPLRERLGCVEPADIHEAVFTGLRIGIGASIREVRHPTALRSSAATIWLTGYRPQGAQLAQKCRLSSDGRRCGRGGTTPAAVWPGRVYVVHGRLSGMDPISHWTIASRALPHRAAA